MSEKTESQVLQLAEEVKPTLAGKVLKVPAEQLSLVEQIQAHSILKKLEEACGSRISVLREALMAIGEATGVTTEGKKTKNLKVDGSKISVEHPEANEPDPDKVRDLLLERGLKLSDAFDEVKTLQFNPSKLDFLVQTGKIKAEEVEALKKKLSPRLKVSPSKEIKAAIETLFEGVTPKELTE